MDAIFAKLKNFWYYYKIPVGIGLAVLMVGAYLSLQSAAAPKPDYHIGLISTTPRSDEQLEALTARFTAAGQDRNGDGQILVRLHTYFVDLADNSPNAGVNNAGKVAALDADLIGKVSGIFLTEDPETLQSVTNGLISEPYLLWEDNLFLCLRTGMSEAYATLFEAVQ